MAAHTDSFYLRRKSGSPVGPFTPQVLVLMLQKGTLDGSEEVSRDRRNWMSVRDVEKTAPPAPAPVPMPSLGGRPVPAPPIAPRIVPAPIRMPPPAPAPTLAPPGVAPGAAIDSGFVNGGSVNSGLLNSGFVNSGYAGGGTEVLSLSDGDLVMHDPAQAIKAFEGGSGTDGGFDAPPSARPSPGRSGTAG